MEHKKLTYSCPMHPDEVSAKPGKCSKCGMDLVKEGQTDHADMDHSNHSHHDHASMMADPGVAQSFLRRFFIVTFLLIPLTVFSKPGMALLGYSDFSLRPYLEFAIATVIFYFGLVFFQHASHEIKSRQYGMMTLVSLAVGAGYLFSAAGTFIPAIATEFYLEISTLIWVLLFGHFLEAKSSSAAGNALQEVAKLLPKKAHLIVSGDLRDVGIAELKKGDMVRVLAGEKVPADGVISSGSANFNEAHISGESKPVEKSKNDSVVAGAICIDGSVEVKLDKVGESSTIGQIQKLIGQAQQTKPTAQRIADKASKWLTFTALGTAILTLSIWSLVIGQPFVFAMTLAITVLVIACPHALGLAIPTVSTIATKLAVANGVFIKDMSKLEVVKDIDYVIFDKTGTLTYGDFTVSQIKPGGSISEKRLLGLVASLEEHSSHMIASSIVNYAKQNKVKLVKVTKFKNLAGKGVEGTIAGKKYFLGKHMGIAIALVSGGEFLGEIVVADKIKSESKKAVDNLHKLGVKVAMLTGDSQEVAKDVAEKLGIDKVFAQVLPENKYKHIKLLQDQGNKVMMVGDGVNDAPALTQANIGVAIGAGTDVAVEAGDIVLTHSNPEDIVTLALLARKVYRKMAENLIWALGYNVLAIPAAAGLFIPIGVRLSPEIGALLMSASSAIVVANAITLKKAKLTTL